MIPRNNKYLNYIAVVKFEKLKDRAMGFTGK